MCLARLRSPGLPLSLYLFEWSYKKWKDTEYFTKNLFHGTLRRGAWCFPPTPAEFQKVIERRTKTFFWFSLDRLSNKASHLLWNEGESYTASYQGIPNLKMYSPNNRIPYDVGLGYTHPWHCQPDTFNVQVGCLCAFLDREFYKP